MARFHAPAEVIARLSAGQAAETAEEDWEDWDGEVEVDDKGRPHLLIPADLWPSVRLFLALSTQWQHAGMAGNRVGLRYEAIRPTAAMAGIKIKPGMFEDLQVMEGAALQEFARLAAEKQKD